MRAINRSLILNVIKSLGPIARAEVARRTGLSPATVTAITAELIGEELVFEKETGDSSGGRRPILLAVNPLGGYVVGMKLTEVEITGALIDLESTVIAKHTRRLDSQEPERVLDDLASMALELIKKAGQPQRKLLGVGVGLAGVIDSKRGVVRQSPFFGWSDLPVRDMLQSRLHVPCYVDNDVNTLTLAEKWFGLGQGVEHFLVLTIGRGIGMGIVVNGQFYRGQGGGAGEFGHTSVLDSGRACDCGKTGCLEATIGEHALLDAAAEGHRKGLLSEKPLTIEQLVSAAKREEEAEAILIQAGTLLGKAVANLVNIFNPQKIIIGGEGVQMGDIFFHPMAAALKECAMPALYQDLEIQIEPLGDDDWALGAASLVLRELFESPVYREAALRS